jgi:hypothetical protein
VFHQFLASSFCCGLTIGHSQVHCLIGDYHTGLQSLYPHMFHHVSDAASVFAVANGSQVHCLIGDYHTGLQSLYPLNLFERNKLYTQQLSGCHITLYYYASFAYLMLQRYTDAGR